MSVEAMKQALEAFEDFVDDPRAQEQINASITALRQAIAEAEKQEPVCDRIHCRCAMKGEWAGLTPADFDWLEQMFASKVSNDFVFADIVCAIEAKLRSKNI